MADSLELLHAVQSIEAQLNIIKRALNDMGIKDEGIIGTFDGECMILDNGRKLPIPPNYASKSMLVPGDTLRMIEDPNGGEQHKFKQIAKAERGKATGLLTRKDGKFEVICEEGSFKVLTAAIKHFEGEPGDQVSIQFARNHAKGSWAAVEKVHKASAGPQAANGGQKTEENDVTSQPHSNNQSSILNPQSPAQPITHAQTEATPVPSIPTHPTPQSVQLQAGHQTEPPASKPSSSSRSSGSNKSSKPKNSSGSRSKSDNSRPVDRPAPDLTPQQGEIAISSLMDDDDLA